MLTPSFSGSPGDSDIRLLKIFTAVVDSGGFTAAAAELDIARSTISTHIANLETRLGVRLCQRGRGGFSLTEEGRLVYQEAQRVLAALDAFRTAVSGASQRLIGDLHLAVIDGILTLPEIPIASSLARFRDAAPDVHVTLSVMSSDEMERRLLDGSVHIAFAGLHRHKSGLRYKEIASEEQLVYCGNTHALFTRPDEQIDEAELTRHAYVGLNLLNSLHATERPYRTKPAATASNLEAILILLGTGRYLGRLPVQYAKPWEESGLVRPIRPDLTRFTQQFALVTRDTKRHGPIISAFLKLYGQ